MMPARMPSLTGALCFASYALLARSVAGAPDPEDLRQARLALDAAALAYRQVPALEDTLTYVVKTPSAVLPEKTMKIKLGAGRQVSMSDPLLEIVALDDTAYLTKSDAPGKYVMRPYAGDLAKVLDDMGGDQGSLFEPLQIAMRTGKDLQGWLAALRFKLLAPLAISGFERKTDSRGQAMEAIRFTAENGEIEADFNASSHFLSHLSLRARPPGAPADVFIQVTGDLAPKRLASPRGLIHFDPTRQAAVANLTSLDSARLPTGKPAPAFELEKATGGTVTLASLRGSVVVLDFWATWCAPCWKTLRETQRLSDWAAKSGLPLAVFAVDTLEEFPTPAEKRDHAAKFFASQSFTMPSLLDVKNEAFSAFGSPGLPSMVVIAPDGTLFKYHQALFPDMFETLQTEVKEAAQLRPQPPGL
jgi:peroxiredoxin